MAERNALAELAERLEQIAEVERESAVFHGDPLNASNDIYTAQRIIAELAKVEQPIPLARCHGKTFTHLADILEADRNRAVEIVRNCRIIAMGGA